jgi:methyl-accepting chemotaxis protein
MIIAFIAITGAIFASVSIVLGNVLNQNLETELRLKADTNAANLNSTIENMVNTIDSFVHDLETSTDKSQETIERAIDNKLSTMPVESITAFYVGIGDRNYLYETMGWIPAPEYVVSTRPWYQSATLSSAPQVLTYEDANTGIYAICVSRGIILDTGEQAVVAVDMEITSSLEANKMLADTEYFFVEDIDGKIIFHRNSAFIPQEGQVTLLTDALPAYTQLDTLRPGHMVEIKDYDGVNYHFAVNEASYGGFRIYTGIQSSTVTRQLTTILLYGLLLALLLIGIATAFFVRQYGQITKPIVSMAQAAAKIATGDTDVDIQVSSNDELGVLGTAFGRMVDEIRRQAEVIGCIAKGDYTVGLPVRSDRDIMNQAIRTMLENNNRLISDIRFASGQVTGGSQQIADGAQSLAQGATEQASAVEKLSASISEVSDSIGKAVSSARHAAALSDSIKGKAEQGTEQMDAMMSAVREINAASQDINKVIKVIDDIAFQTNILALNAAVEAARAGQHGKGFSVVAEEVRNLAAKSAEAAKETGALIENSIAKANLGFKIASSTSESLKEIVEGIITSSQISSEIASSADQQFAAIAEINTGLDQVTRVVRQNSLTAEESAASSRELTGQASTLSGLISRFSLKDQPTSAYANEAAEERDVG